MAPNWRVSKIKRRLLYKDSELSSVITKQQVLIKQKFQYNIHSTAFGNFDILGERSILLNIFWVVSHEFEQNIPY